MLEMEEEKLSQLIDDSLDSILSGTQTLEEVVARYPEQADLLRQELEVAMWLVSQKEQFQARPGFAYASKKRVLERIRGEGNGALSHLGALRLPWRLVLSRRWFAAFAIMLMMFLGINRLVSFSQGALPGDPLYAIKRSYEQVVMTIAGSDVQRVNLGVQFSKKRLDEANQLIMKGDTKAAQSSLKEFEQGVTQTVTLLAKMDDSHSTQKEQLAATVRQDLTGNATQLETLLRSAPANMKDTVARARITSLQGASQAQTVENNSKEAAQTATTAPISRPTSTRKPYIQPTSTSRPPVVIPTPVNTPVPPVMIPPAPTSTSVPPTDQPTATNTPLPTATNTPLPTATNTALPTATDTPLPTATDTATPLPTATDTPLPTATSTSVPPTATLLSPTPTATPSGAPVTGGTVDETPSSTPSVIPTETATPVP